MKKLMIYFLLLLPLALTSCGDDNKDEPNVIEQGKITGQWKNTKTVLVNTDSNDKLEWVFNTDGSTSQVKLNGKASDDYDWNREKAENLTISVVDEESNSYYLEYGSGGSFSGSGSSNMKIIGNEISGVTNGFLRVTTAKITKLSSKELVIETEDTYYEEKYTRTFSKVQE